MTVIRDDDNERLVRIEHMIETIRNVRRTSPPSSRTAQRWKEAAKTRDGARTVTAQLGKRRTDTDET